MLQCVYSRIQDWRTSVQRNLCQNVLYHIGNCVTLCQYGEGFFLVIKGFIQEVEHNPWVKENVGINNNTHQFITEFKLNMINFLKLKMQLQALWWQHNQWQLEWSDATTCEWVNAIWNIICKGLEVYTTKFYFQIISWNWEILNFIAFKN